MHMNAHSRECVHSFSEWRKYVEDADKTGKMSSRKKEATNECMNGT